MIQPIADNTGVQAILAQANLSRIRGKWEEAREQCMDALCHDPHSVAAHSLLGDIHADQGKLDDAIQWYCIALDLQPDSLADKNKLLRAVEDRKNQISHSPRKIGAAIENITSTLTVMTSRRIVRSERAVRAAVLAAALLMLAAIVAAPLVMAYRRQSEKAFSYSGGSQIIQTPALVLNRLPGDADLTPPAAPEQVLPADPFDQTLLSHLRANTDLRLHGVEPVDVASDPRTARVTLTFVSAAVPAGSAVRAVIVRNAARLAQAAAVDAQPNEIAVFTLRALYDRSAAPSGAAALASPLAAGAPAPAPSSAPMLAFVADIAAGEVSPANGENSAASEASVEDHFTSVWWSPTLPT